MCESQEDALKHQLETAQALINKCQHHANVKGIDKLRKKCVAELKYLKRLVAQSSRTQDHQLRSSNLGHLQGLLDVIDTFPGTEEVLKCFRACRCDKPRPSLVVDVICNHGNAWVKVVARKAQATHLVWAGQGQFGDKSVVDHARHYLHCSGHHPHEYVHPSVVFYFCQGVTPPLHDALVRLGVTVNGSLQPVGEDTLEKLRGVCLEHEMASWEKCDSNIRTRIAVEKVHHEAPSGDQPEITGDETPTVLLPSDQADIRQTEHHAGDQSELHYDETSTVLPPSDQADIKQNDLTIKKINLDITSVICLISNLCHGHCDYTFKDDVLNYQAEQERKKAVLPALQEFMKGKELLMCETALKDFEKILGTVGGEREKERARELLKHVTIVPDFPSPSTETLKESGKIKRRPKVIFGTGSHLKAVTMTANSSFIRAASNQGVNYVVFLHEPRALTEQKEKTATRLHSSENTGCHVLS